MASQELESQQRWEWSSRVKLDLNWLSLCRIAGWPSEAAPSLMCAAAFQKKKRLGASTNDLFHSSQSIFGLQTDQIGVSLLDGQPLACVHKTVSMIQKLLTLVCGSSLILCF